MHTIELRRQALDVALRLGYKIREEWLGGGGGGACEFGGTKWIFVDLALNAVEQVEQIREALVRDPAIHTINLSPPMRKLFGLNKLAA